MYCDNFSNNSECVLCVGLTVWIWAVGRKLATFNHSSNFAECSQKKLRSRENLFKLWWRFCCVYWCDLRMALSELRKLVKCAPQLMHKYSIFERYPYFGHNYCPFCPLCGYVIDTARRLRGWSSAFAYGGREALTLVRSWLPPDGIRARPRKPTSVDRRVRALPLVCQYTAVNRWTA